MTAYDNKSVNHQLLLDLPFLEASGIITRDQSKPHHKDIDMVNTPTWATLSSDLGVLELDGATEYIELASGSCPNLNFVTSDYSLCGWVKWEHNPADDDHVIIGRYQVDNTGWELYLYDDNPDFILTLRHHHSLTTPAGSANPRSACYSYGWSQSTWLFFGVTRTGTSQTHYKNGYSVTTTCTTTGLVDPEACPQDLVIGVRGTTKGDDFFKGQMQGLRVWDRAVTASEWLYIFETEKHWFGL